MNRKKIYTVNAIFDALWDDNVSEISDLNSDDYDYEENEDASNKHVEDLPETDEKLDVMMKMI